MMYTQQAGHLPPGIKTATDLAAHIENVLAPKEYAVILHDQDISEDGTPAEAHLHAMLCFRNVLTVSDVSKILGIGKNTAYDFIRSGAIKSVRVGRQIRVPKSAFLEFLS